MNFEELKRQLPSKQRTVADLARYITTRTDDNSNYNLLLGAGCSINSGVRSANELIQLWRTEILGALTGGKEALDKSIDSQKEFLKNQCSEWYDPSREYSSLFERRYDLQRQRRMFVEKEVSGAFPSIGYAYLTSLVSKGYFRTLFTTNFDDLLNEAFYTFSTERPIVCAHDSSIVSVTVTSKRPKVIKLHGDYLFDDLKATTRETESLESNMKAKFFEFSKEAGFIVIGYSGADRSIMDIFSTLLKNDDYLKGGVYWCLRSDSEVPEELRRVFWRDRAYYVQIDGFDEFFAELFNRSHPDDYLPSSLTATTRPSGVTERLLASPRAIPDTTDILRKAKSKLNSLTKRSAIAGLIVQSNNEERPAIRGQRDDLTDDELLVLTEATNLITDGRYQTAIDKLGAALGNDCRPLYKRRLLTEQIQAFRLKGDDVAALTVLEKLIAMNPGMGSNYLLQASIESNEKKKLVAIEKGIEAEPYLAGATREKANWCLRAARNCVGEERKKLLESACELLERCLELSPTLANPGWSGLFSALAELHRFDKSIRTTKQKNLLDRMSKQNPESYWVLSKRIEFAASSGENSDINSALLSLDLVEKRYGLESVPWVAGLQLDAYGELFDSESIERIIQKCEKEDLLYQDGDLAYKAAVAIRKTFGDEPRAERILLGALKQWDFEPDVFDALFDMYIDLERVDDAGRLFKDWSHHLVERERLRLLTNLFEAQGDYTKSLSLVMEREAKSGVPIKHEAIYLNLCAGNFSVAERLARETLTRYNFSPEADVETVNYELARKAQSKKPDATRLEAVLKINSAPTTQAAIYHILGRKPETLKALKEEYSRDRRVKYLFKRWPVFTDVQKDVEFAFLVS